MSAKDNFLLNKLSNSVAVQKKIISQLFDLGCK